MCEKLASTGAVANKNLESFSYKSAYRRLRGAKLKVFFASYAIATMKQTSSVPEVVKNIV